MIRYPKRFTVLCDGCPASHSDEHLVEEANQPARHELARTHVRLLGWTCDARGDFCPGCKT